MKKSTRHALLVACGALFLVAVVGSCVGVNLRPADEREEAAVERMAAWFGPEFRSYRYDFEAESLVFADAPDEQGVLTASVRIEVVKDAEWRELLRQLEALNPGLTISACLTTRDRTRWGRRSPGYCTWRRLDAQPDLVLSFGSADWNSHHQARAETLRLTRSHRPRPRQPKNDPRDRSAWDD